MFYRDTIKALKDSLERERQYVKTREQLIVRLANAMKLPWDGMLEGYTKANYPEAVAASQLARYIKELEEAAEFEALRVKVNKILAEGRDGSK